MCSSDLLKIETKSSTICTMTRLPLFSLCFVIIIHLGDNILISAVFDDDINNCYDSFDYIRYGVVVLAFHTNEIIVRSPTKRDIICLF